MRDVACALVLREYNDPVVLNINTLGNEMMWTTALSPVGLLGAGGVSVTNKPKGYRVLVT